MTPPTPPAALSRRRRWGVLAAYAFVVGMSQMLWLNFGPLLTLIQTRYGVSELTASLLLLVFPLLYVLLSLPAGAMIDARGYRFTVGLGAFGMAAFACVRIFDDAFWPLLVGQIGIAITQPYIVNGISKLVADWFSEEQAAIATGIATMGMFIGMALGMAVTPALVASIGLRGAMIAFALLTIASAVIFAAVVQPNAQAASSAPASVDASSFGALLAHRDLRLFFLLSFLGLGVFNGLTTWLEQILAPHGINAEQAGLVGGALLGGGIVGSVVLPALSDRTQRRRPFLILCVAGALATIYPLCVSSRYPLLLALGTMHGFFFLPALALLIEMCTQIAGARAAGATTSLIMLTGNAGGFVVVLAMPLIKGGAADFRAGVLLMTALLAVAALLTLRAPETYLTTSAAGPSS